LHTEGKDREMKVLHITPHFGGGVGTVITAWMEKLEATEMNMVKNHSILCLDVMNDKAREALEHKVTFGVGIPLDIVNLYISKADIVLIHYWDHPMLQTLLSQPLPPCRLAFWCHKNFPVPNKILAFPDRYYNTSAVQGSHPAIWSTGNMDRFFKVQHIPQEKFHIGYVGWVDYRKLHDKFLYICDRILNEIPDATITVCGEVKIDLPDNLNPRLKFVGQVDDVAPYLATFDVFGYPLRPDHFGTCEQSLGEAMAAGVPPLVMNNMAERWIVEDGWNGFRSTNPDQYIYFMKLLHKHRRYIDYFSGNAKRKAKSLYNINRMVNLWDEVFESMMEKPKNERKPL
jgi:glycosyltransferase involved in cell wall biosynthesis